ncbi:MAG: 50S ribosomal protein L11 methyltransferase [Candidatus Omnitrophica bacterium]|nr:50S ribosomal protein L11 methyltransferase [Candidatus Omnitrophota bacterium]
MTRIPTKNYEVSLSVDRNHQGQEEILACLFEGLAIAREDIVEEYTPSKLQVKVYCSREAKAKQLLAQIEQFNLKNLTVTCRVLTKTDWLTKWHDEFKPFALTKNIWVVPAWLKNKFSMPNKSLIYIDTTVAFGTGLHPTTQYMAKFIEQSRKHFKSFLDIGTGTGILTLVALCCQAKDVFALDISRDAIRIAQENFKNNGFDTVKTHAVDFNKFKHEKTYDFVAANLITQDLIQFKNKIVAKVKLKGYLAVSGISVDNIDKFRKEFSTLPLRCIKIKKGKGWSALLFRRV